MLATAPAVVKRFHMMDMARAGKLALEATAKARPTMKATFCFSNTMPSTTATSANTRMPPIVTAVTPDTIASVAGRP